MRTRVAVYSLLAIGGLMYTGISIVDRNMNNEGLWWFLACTVLSGIIILIDRLRKRKF